MYKNFLSKFHAREQYGSYTVKGSIKLLVIIVNRRNCKLFRIFFNLWGSFNIMLRYHQVLKCGKYFNMYAGLMKSHTGKHVITIFIAVHDCMMLIDFFYFLPFFILQLVCFPPLIHMICL